jgi:SAM-dependent methyltransferase
MRHVPMTRAWDTITAYNRGFREFSAAFEAFSFAEIHAGALPFVPQSPGLALDIGAGSGRDADWFAHRNWEIVAVEPAAAMRLEAMRLHPSPRIRWIDDSLPALAAVQRLGLSFDLIWLSGVWMHVAPDDRRRAMRKLATLLRPGGRIVMTLRHGPTPDDRPMWPVHVNEVEKLGLEMGLALRVATEHVDDLQRRLDVRWQTVILDLPDDGAGALPLLRGVILKQEKSATYKLALLRCIARIADASPNVARETERHVELPLGLVALYWLRMFKPLIANDIPQRPGHAMGFVTDAFLALNPLAASELRPGAVFTGHFGEALRRALGHAAKLIATMPATHLTFADNAPVFPTEYGRMPPGASSITLTQEFLWQYGTTQVPPTVWQALRRMAAWIEPMLVAEWIRLTKLYAERLGKRVTADQIMAALRWIDPERDTDFVRDLALRRLASGAPVTCVWSGKALVAGSLDIDHCLPWSAWPCADLWNLLPSAPAVNRNNKREKLISAQALSAAKPLIMNWWQTAYVDSVDSLRERFAEEARASLPILKPGAFDLDEMFLALDFRRLRLRQDTQVAEWFGTP